MRFRHCAVSILVLVPLLHAGYGSDNPRLAKLYGEFISPCCWRENLTVHDSPVAQQLRDQIAVMVRQGKSDDQIKSSLIGVYGKRILALPEGEERTWLFMTPVAIVVLGAGFVCLALMRMRKQAVPAT